MLVRNSDIHSARLTLRQLEDRFNRRYQYPYVFLNDVPFTNEFQEWIRPMSKANMTFATVPKEHWHEALMPFDYYWRIEPDVEFLCDIDFDPFLYMQENQKKYGFTITMVEYPETIPSLWTTVQEFVEKQPHHLAPDNLRSMISFGRQQKYYNGCHFWTNFELADLRWFRSAAYEAFFEHLDRAGGFFYERWGDAPVHSIAAALLLNKDEIHYFRDIGYKHHPYLNCPLDPEAQLKCHCDPRANINSKPMNGFIGCTRHFLRLTGAKDILSEDMGEDVRDYVYRDGPQDRGNEADNQQPQHQQQGQIIVKFQNRQEHSRAFKNRRGDEAHLPLVPVYQSPERKEFKN
ncbi:hypothetical protein DFQ27_000288 [Actinomortierella ambigua]|uniref:Glycosyltransferase family 15 protein n=1 Tax=Actinomortierella ambigua TaxID=1343610 RepID=A0A9P6QHA7_9FUNG|nr:hypothetical protein DFQ27_000288 [Actinomortierella ambigua]